MTSHDFDNRIDSLARRQLGTFSRRQVLERGGTRRMVAERLASGRWLRIDSGVYALASHRSTWNQRMLAATLGERTAVASGISAAALHRFTNFPRAGLEVTVPPENHHVSRLAKVRRSPLVDPTLCEGIPTNSAALTLFELAGRFPGRVEPALESALRSKATTMGELVDWYVVLEQSRRPGLRLMHRLLERRGGIGYTPSESELETALYEALDIPEFQPFVRQAPAPWNPGGQQRVDGLIERGRIIVEADSYEWHGGFSATKRDRRRDRRANACGYECLRFYWDELTEDRRAVRAEVRAIQAQRIRTLAS